MANRFMQSTSELCFADRDLLPSYCRKPESRESYRSNPDMDEVQRFYGADNDLAYLCSAETRQDIHPDDLEALGLTSEDDFHGQDEASAEELIAEYYRDHPGDPEPLHTAVHLREQTVTRHQFVPMKATEKMLEDKIAELRDAREETEPEGFEAANRELDLRIRARCELSRELENRTVRVTEKTVKKVLVGAKPRREPVDAEEAAIRRRSRSEAREATDRSYRRHDHARGGNSKPRDRFDRKTVRRMVEYRKAEVIRLVVHRDDKIGLLEIVAYAA